MAKETTRVKIRETAGQKVVEIRKTMATAIAAAFGFTMALFWNDAIKSTVDYVLKVFDLSGSSYIYKVLVAIVVTIISAIVISYVSRWGSGGGNR